MLGVSRHTAFRFFSLKCCTSTLRPYQDTNTLLEIRWCCSACSGYSFFCFQESSEVRKDFFVDGPVGVWAVKGTHESSGDEGRARARHWTKGAGERESL